jgi:hypothetical protein
LDLEENSLILEAGADMANWKPRREDGILADVGCCCQGPAGGRSSCKSRRDTKLSAKTPPRLLNTAKPHHRQASPASITARQITCPSSENPLNLDQFADLLLLLPTKILFQNSGRLENHTQSSIFHLKKPP